MNDFEGRPNIIVVTEPGKHDVFSPRPAFLLVATGEFSRTTRMITWRSALIHDPASLNPHSWRTSHATNTAHRATFYWFRDR